MSVDITTDVEPVRPAFPAISKGLKCKCPNCGKGKMFEGYLRVVPECPSCAEELHHHRADDFPPYLVIFIVGHIMVTLVMLVEARWDLSTLTHILIWLPLTVMLSLALLQPLKGAVVGLQWALRMHGFGGEEDQ